MAHHFKKSKIGVKTEAIEFLRRARQNGLERRLLATVRWTVATAVAFPQESESLAHHFFFKRLTEVPRKRNFIEFLRDSNMYLEN